MLAGRLMRTRLGPVPCPGWCIRSSCSGGGPAGAGLGWGTCHGALGRAVWLQIPEKKILKKTKNRRKKGKGHNGSCQSLNSSQVSGRERLITVTQVCRCAVTATCETGAQRSQGCRERLSWDPASVRSLAAAPCHRATSRASWGPWSQGLAGLVGPQGLLRVGWALTSPGLGWVPQ